MQQVPPAPLPPAQPSCPQRVNPPSPSFHICIASSSTTHPPTGHPAKTPISTSIDIAPCPDLESLTSRPTPSPVALLHSPESAHGSPRILRLGSVLLRRPCRISSFQHQQASSSTSPANLLHRQHRGSPRRSLLRFPPLLTAIHRLPIQLSFT